MDNTNSPTYQIAKFAADLRFADLPEKVQQQLIGFFLDYFRVASIGERMEWSRWGLEYADKTAKLGTSSILFSKQSLDPVSASFTNTLYSGSIDADDVHVGAMLHPGCIMFSVALAIGQMQHSSGEQMLAAVAAGYESMIRIALAIQPSHFKRGFQSTSTIGVFGAAITASKLLSNNADSTLDIAHAMGLGASFAGGLTQFYHSGSTVKRLHAAQAASSGVKAALLVKSGFSGPTDILEGKDGFFRAYADSFDASILSQELGSYFRISEVAVKPHACSARVLSAIEATANICKQYRIDVEKIQSIYLGIPKVIQGRLTSNAPKDVQAAQMSAPFCVALTLLQNLDSQIFSLSVEDFDSGMKNQQVMYLTSLVNCVVDDEIEKTSSEESVSAKVVIHLKNGEEFSNVIIAPKGSISRPFTLEDHQLGMKHELSKRYPENHINQFEKLILEFPKVKDIAQEITTAWLN